MLNGKGMIILLIVGLVKKDIYKNESMFSYTIKSSKNINVEIDLSNYAKKKDINDITHVDTSNFALKTILANLKTEVDQLYIGKLATVPVDLSKLSNVVKMILLKNCV